MNLHFYSVIQISCTYREVLFFSNEFNRAQKVKNYIL
jgi:hypothetical protein